MAGLNMNDALGYMTGMLNGDLLAPLIGIVLGAGIATFVFRRFMYSVDR